MGSNAEEKKREQHKWAMREYYRRELLALHASRAILRAFDIVAAKCSLMFWVLGLKRDCKLRASSVRLDRQVEETKAFRPVRFALAGPALILFRHGLPIFHDHLQRELFSFW